MRVLVTGIVPRSIEKTADSTRTFFLDETNLLSVHVPQTFDYLGAGQIYALH